MKLAKLSLAAVVAAGSFSMANAAVSLEEAIKDVQVSGFLRYRLDGKRVTEKDDGNKTIKSHDNMNKFRAEVVANMKFNEYFSGNAGVRFDAWDSNVESSPYVLNGVNATGDEKNNVAFRDLNIVYENPDVATKVIAGRQVVKTLYTNGVLGNGILAINSSVDNVAFAAFYFANLDSKDSSRSVPVLASERVVEEGNPAKDVTYVDVNEDIMHKPLYGIGVLTNFGGVSANLWAAQIKDTATVYGLDAKAGIEVDDGKNVSIVAQVSQTDFSNKFVKKANYVLATGDIKDKKKVPAFADFVQPEKDLLVDSTNFNVNVGFDMGVFNAKVGYAMTGNKKGTSTTAVYDSGTFETMGEILMDYDLVTGQNQFIYAGLGAQVDEFSAGFEYVNLVNKIKDDTNKTKGNEYVVRLGYDYNKKLAFSGFYAFADEKYDKEKTETNKFRIEAKYSF